ncbi:MAG: ABC transporter ATP-binding protein [Candidatus Atelocyanobacterium thalassa]|uniref:ABC-type quaternary amine transporter n=1 Tax=Candidatus Atelocyanobacterium thalassa isolate SIO64986 TaxID=1527444 RepID=A0A086CFZ6_9CHRO|nr:MAG: ABC-type spermidine/putrescine transport system, ATPase component [Candidatus Atelocyanobacterium thalassa isolate SIO64986]
MTDSIILQVDHIVKQFLNHTTAAIDQVSFKLKQGEILGLLGPSGCGKTTLLRVIAGFEKPSVGTIELAGNIIASPYESIPPEYRNTGMVFQDYALFPHLNIASNIAFGLKKKNLSRNKVKQRVGESLALVGLEGLEKRYPHQLSGGQQQRIALARALAPKPALILLDEPLSNLDVQVRLQLRHEIRHVLKGTGITAIFVTHDQEEALAISDKIGVMSYGKIEQFGTPEEVYTHPSSRFVAEFVTQANFIPAKRKGRLWTTEIGQWEAPSTFENIPEGDLMVRQEDITLQPDDTGEIVICDRQFLGREYCYCLKTPSGCQIHARTTLQTQLPIGTRVQLIIVPQSPQVFPAVPFKMHKRKEFSLLSI